MIDIKELIEDREKLNEDTLLELKDLVERYPFFQTARILYLANLYKLHSMDFGKELRKASVFVPDRSALFCLTEGINYELDIPTKPVGTIETENDENRTISLIDSFLSGSKSKDGDNKDESARNTPSIADLTNDYASFLAQQADSEQESQQSASSGLPRLKGADLIDNFIEETRGKQRFEITNSAEDDFVSPEFSLEDEEIYTESMVKIYINQGRYLQALEILRKICLNNPKKSANFAAQIKLLEIIIQENK